MQDIGQSPLNFISFVRLSTHQCESKVSLVFEFLNVI